MTITWLSPPLDLKLNDHEVHIWSANLDVQLHQIQHFLKNLSNDEKLRADRFYFEQHRQRFIVGRGTLRVILGRYLGIEPSQLQFEYSDRGKPTLPKSYNRDQLQFNLSHSQGLALYGFTRKRKIGIDLEYLRSLPDAEQIAQRFFCARESQFISILTPEEKEKAFFRGWTAKEAYLKATGDGLSGSLEQVEVSLIPDKPLHLISIQGDSQIAAQWRIYDFIPVSNYIATLAVEGQDWNLSCWQG